MPKGVWTPLTTAQEEYMESNYLKLPIKHIAKTIGVSFGRVKRYLDKNELVIPFEVVEQRKKASQFNKGHISFNKGKKQQEYMSLEAIERTKKTRFKKGNKPHNTNYNGHERVCSKDGYILIRVTKGKYVLKHRLVWEQNNGPIPEGSVIRFKDGDKLNLDPSNLELISKDENMILNSRHYHPETKKSVLLNYKIQKTIKSIENGKK